MSAKEWMRICFELLELLKAHKKAIRRATVNTFGYIAKAIGPHDVLATLLNNLRVIKFYTINACFFLNMDYNKKYFIIANLFVNQCIY